MNRLPISLADVEAAAGRIRGRALRTPCLEMPALSEAAGLPIFAKCELFQRTGSFKYRGAAHAVSRLPESARSSGVATHSSGNHGQALACAARERGFPCHVVMPHNAPAAKREAVEAFGGRVIACEPTLEAREAALAKVVAETGAAFISPYNNADVIAGQGTIGLEIVEDLPDVDAIVVPVGGGGLVSGIAVAAKGRRSQVVIIGAEPAIADDASRSKRSGVMQPSTNALTIADGLRGALGTLTFPVVRELVDRIELADEEAIAQSMRFAWEQLKLTIEASAAVGVAVVRSPAFRDLARERKWRNAAIIFCGGNVDLDHLPWSK
ncbi:MAG: pyridoxal-phosphate dependent enzyme [Planctomycetes bacterium]|nr:pyridoxal-phosphate dependent enzyme [Planctomycetota bacterium]